MPDSLFPSSGFPLVVLLIYILLFLLQLFYYLFFFLRFASYSEKEEAGNPEGVSVVICARNEYLRLKEHLPLILGQDYPLFEVVVVNHASDDESSVLLSRMAEEYPALKIVEIRENLNFFDGKKFPLSIGIKSASYDRILLTDADCRPAGTGWITAMSKGFTGGKEIVLGYGAYKPAKSLLNRLIRFDTAHIALQYFSYALAGIPYMGVGRNMAYLKSLFYQKKGFTSHYTIHSGDDDLFINQAATKTNTRVVATPESFTFSDAKNTFRDWWIQKKRHLSTGRHYRPVHKFLLGLYSLSTVLFYGFLALLLLMNCTIWLVLALFILRMTTQLILFRKTLKHLNEKGIWLLVPILEIILILLNTLLTISAGLTKEQKWK